MGKKKCIEPNCDKFARDKSGKCKSHGGGKRCIEQGCTKSAVDNYDKCKTHGGGNRCIEPGCKKAARDKTNKCVEHGGGKRCIETGCTKSAQGKTDKCVEHGGGTLCNEPDCMKAARGKTNKCVEHGGGLCVEPNCKKAAQGKTDKCIKHGGGNRCSENGCKKSAQDNTDKCVKHGGGKRCIEKGCTKASKGKTNKCIEHMGGKRCSELNCTKSAQGNSDKCIEHGGGNRCPNCIDWIDSRSGSYKYDGYCATCFKVLFPDDERSKVVYRHTKEIRVRNEINKYFEGFIHDKPLYTHNCDCTHRRRIDHRKLIGNTILAIETDEFAHSGYDPLDEEIRYDDLYMVHSGKWVFIRFNPDGKGVDLFPEEKRSYEVAIEDKLDVLIREIDKQITRIEYEENTDLLEVVKLYY